MADHVSFNGPSLYMPKGVKHSEKWARARKERKAREEYYRSYTERMTLALAAVKGFPPRARK